MNEVLDELLCTFCHNYLSVPPIQSGPGGQNICGRCTFDENFLPHHNTLYETVIKDLNFPCQYETKGCPKKTSLAYMKAHEIRCSYRSFPCPSYASCDFHGGVKELSDHFEVEHPECIFRNIELSVGGIKNYVHFSGDDMFLVIIERRKELYVRVVYLVDEEVAERYVFTLWFSTTDPGVTYNVLGNVDTCKTIKIDDLLNHLNNPSVVLCDIETKKITDTVINLLRAIECPVCFCHMSQPILQCHRGHSFCKTCHDRLKKCSICQHPMATVRNVNLERIALKILRPCKYQRLECPYYGSIRDVIDHEDNCMFKP